jgi:hypothetical protein
MGLKEYAEDDYENLMGSLFHLKNVLKRRNELDNWGFYCDELTGGIFNQEIIDKEMDEYKEEKLRQGIVFLEKTPSLADGIDYFERNKDE